MTAFRIVAALAPIAFVFASASNASAQTPTSAGVGLRPSLYVNFGGGGTSEERAKGGAVAFGVTVRAGLVLVTLTPADLILAPADTWPYYRDTFDNGDSVCRNSTNGQFADESNCTAVDTTYAATLDFSARIPRTPLLLGVGYRFGGSPTPNLWFGTAGVVWTSSTQRLLATVKLNVGSDYYSGLATVGVRLGGG